MEQGESIPFSSVVAGLLLCKNYVTSLEIVNFISKLNCEGMDINDIEDDIDDLMVCVQIHEYYSFSLKDNLSYETVLYGNVTVRKFLEGYVDKRVLEIIQRDNMYFNDYQFNDCNDICEENTLSFPIFWRKKESAKKSTKLEKTRKPLKKDRWYSFLW